MTLEEEYKQRFERILSPLSKKLDVHLHSLLSGTDRIDRISTRPKSVERFVAKANKEEEGKPKYSDPLNQIQDQIGSRIITFYLSDVEKVSQTIKEYLRPIEQREIIPEKENEFGYIGKHFILFLPSDIFNTDICQVDAPKVFELQVKTLFQHAWSEANHDLGYKTTCPLDSHQKRRMAFTAAQAWGADHMFNELFDELFDTAIMKN